MIFIFTRLGVPESPTLVNINTDTYQLVTLNTILFSMKRVFKFTTITNNLLLHNIDLLHVNEGGSEFWKIRSLINTAFLPRVIMIPFNYSLGDTVSKTVPLLSSNGSIRYDRDYYGASIRAYINILPQYTYLGCVKYALYAIFVINDEIHKFVDKISSEQISSSFTFPNVKYGIERNKSNKGFFMNVI